MVPALIAAVISVVSVRSPHPLFLLWRPSEQREVVGWSWRKTRCLCLSAFPGFSNKDKLASRQFLFVILWQ